ncbi:MAG: acetyltransferase [Sphingopyxis sp.]|nr:MAG: acetyltransferase [Sphingopyxis sp.]
MRRLFRFSYGLFSRTRFAFSRIYWSVLLGKFDSSARIYPTAIIRAPRNVRIGKNVVINDFVHIWGAGSVEIGDETMIAAHSAIISQTHDTEALRHAKLYRETLILESVNIGRNVWVGSNVSILPGVTIGDNAILAAGSVVNKSVPKNCIVAGVPARIIRDLQSSKA